MNWEMISAVDHMLAAIGVIIALVYLAIQIRSQNQESRSAAINTLVTHFSDLMRSQGENAELCDLWLHGLQSFEELDSASRVRFGSQLGRQIRTADSLYLHFLDGTLDPRLWRGFDRAIADIAAYPGFQKWWLIKKHWYSDELRGLIDYHVKTAKPKIYEGYF
jgi:hypothetical protein